MILTHHFHPANGVIPSDSNKCCPYIERMQESVRAAYRSYAAAYGYEL
jgi:hypothetical protein